MPLSNSTQIPAHNHSDGVHTEHLLGIVRLNRKSTKLKCCLLKLNVTDAYTDDILARTRSKGINAREGKEQQLTH